MFAPLRGDLSECLARVDWAERAVREINALGRQHAWVFQSDRAATDGPPLLMRARLTSSNVVHQLRSALDNLVWQLVIANGREPSRANAFPIRSDDPGGRRIFNDRLINVHEDHKAVIDRCQPWSWPRAARDDHPLARLEAMWNADKHRVLAFAETRPERLELRTTPVPIPAGALVYEDGRRVVPTLQRAVGCVDAIVRSFALDLAGQPAPVEIAEDNIRYWAEACRLRDPSGTYLEYREYALGFLGRDLRGIPTADIRLALASAQRVLGSPMKTGFEQPLLQVERELTERLAILNYESHCRGS